MSIESDLYDRLSGFAGLAALVGTRLYPNRLPEAVAYPALSWLRVSSIRPIAMGSDSGIVRMRLQVDVWATGHDSMTAVAEQVRLALRRWRKTSGTEVLDCFMDNEIDQFEADAPDGAGRTGLFHRALDFELIYREA